MALLHLEDLAPDFQLGNGRMASSLWEHSHLVLYFFPKAFTPG